jgi:hypothetical protein
MRIDLTFGRSQLLVKANKHWTKPLPQHRAPGEHKRFRGTALPNPIRYAMTNALGVRELQRV